MGKGSVILIRFDDNCYISLYQFKRVYHWLSIYIPKEKRGTNVSAIGIMCVLKMLKGKHHIHVLRRLKTLRNNLSALGAIDTGKSKVFADCVCYAYKVDRNLLIFPDFSLEVLPYKKDSLKGKVLPKSVLVDVINNILELH